MARTKLNGKKTRKPKGNGYDPKTYPGIAENACRMKGLKGTELAELFGVTHSTIDRWIKNHREFKEAVKRGRDRYDVEHVENALLKRALGYEYEEISTMEISLTGEKRNGTKVLVPGIKTTITTKQVVPDVKACMFWLQNRNPNRWKNTKYLDVKGQHEHKHDHQHTLQDEQLKNLEDDELRLLHKLATQATTDLEDREGTVREESERLH